MTGPASLKKPTNLSCLAVHDLKIDPEELPEVDTRPQAFATRAVQTQSLLFDGAAQRISKWNRLIRVVSKVIWFVWTIRERIKIKHGQTAEDRSGQRVEDMAVQHLIRECQVECFCGETVSSEYGPLSPFTDRDGIIRVGGRLKNSSYGLFVKHPILLPARNQLSNLILRYYHELSKHQGRHVTLGALRDAGYYMVKGNRAIRELLKTCVICRKLRAPCEQQFMADLPSDRTEAAPPFTNTGLDVMGPWQIRTSRQTRSRSGTQKMWAVIFCCQVSRAVHVELLPHLDTVSFRNALRRFLAIRGACKIIRSDRGTNFIGLVNENLNFENVIQGMESKCQWIFNPPHASHFGGAWERKIGQVKRALDAAILQAGLRLLCHDELNTLLQEAAAIVNATPLWEISADANEPQPLSPAMLLTMKHTLPEEQSYDRDEASYGKRRWRRVHLADEFWTRWRREYLQELQSRQKWIMKSKCLSVGDVVLVKDKVAKRNLWPVAVITKVRVSNDNLVRSATIKIARSTPDKSVKHFLYERPITELVLLIKA